MAIGSAAHAGSASTPKRGYSGQHSGGGVRCQSEAGAPDASLGAGRSPFGGRALVRRTEPRSTGSRPCRASIPIAESARPRHIRSTGPLNRRRIERSTAGGDRSGGSTTFPEFLDVGIERRAGDPHEGADLLHRALPRPVELHGVAALFLIEPLAAAADAPSGAGGSQAGARAFSDQRPLELRQRRRRCGRRAARCWSRCRSLPSG